MLFRRHQRQYNEPIQGSIGTKSSKYHYVCSIERDAFSFTSYDRRYRLTGSKYGNVNFIIKTAIDLKQRYKWMKDLNQ
jgi:hypothetical protein